MRSPIAGNLPEATERVATYRMTYQALLDVRRMGARADGNTVTYCRPMPPPPSGR